MIFYSKIKIRGCFALICLLCCLPDARAEKNQPPALNLDASSQSLNLSVPTKIKSIFHVGILPYHLHDGKMYFLLSKNTKGEWGDFGGPWGNEGISYLKTALDYCSKQTRYVFGKLALAIRPLEKTLSRDEIDNCSQQSNNYLATRITNQVHNKKNSSHMFLAHVDFVPEDTFNNASPVPDQKKLNYAWIPASEFMQTIGKIKNRWQAFYLNKQINRHFFDICTHSYDEIMRIVSQENKNIPLKEEILDLNVPDLSTKHHNVLKNQPNNTPMPYKI